jgi:hypothetical protein
MQGVVMSSLIGGRRQRIVGEWALLVDLNRTVGQAIFYGANIARDTREHFRKSLEKIECESRHHCKIDIADFPSLLVAITEVSN